MRVLSGEIIAGPHVRNACRRHLDDLEAGHERGLEWDEASAGHVYRFFERGLKLSEGQFEGRAFDLHPSQAFILGSLFGWKRTDGTRRFRRAYLEMGKGNGKSPLAGGIGLYGLTADEEPGAQIYAAAAKKEQAAILFHDAVKMMQQSPALQTRLKASGGMGREYNIAHHASKSFFRPISKDAGKTGSGPRPHFALCDEVHEHPDRSIMEMLERGFKFRRQPLLLMITNSGTDRNSICWEEHEHATKVAAGTREPDDDFTYVGEPIDDETFAFVCALDKDDDPFEDETCWIKANPLLGVTIAPDYLRSVAKQAIDLPGKRNGILRLHFCVWTDAETSWMARPTLERVLHKFDPKEHEGKEICVGIDLGSVQDMTAMAFVVPTGTVERERPDGSIATLPTFDAWVEAWTPEDTVAERERNDKAHYSTWIEQGWLNATPGEMVRFDFVAARLAEIATRYRIKVAAYDRHTFRRFEEECQALGLALKFAEHPQGGKKRGKPPDDAEDAQGLWMPGSILALEELILEQRIRLRSNPVLISACMSAAFDHDPLDNRWLVKAKATKRIDVLVALCMGVGAAVLKAETMSLDDFFSSPVHA